MWCGLLDHTFDVFVVSCDVLESGEANGFGTYDRSDSLCVFAVANYPTLAHYESVDIGIHLRIDKGDVITQVQTAVFDSFD